MQVTFKSFNDIMFYILVLDSLGQSKKVLRNTCCYIVPQGMQFFDIVLLIGTIVTFISGPLAEGLKDGSVCQQVSVQYFDPKKDFSNTTVQILNCQEIADLKWIPKDFDTHLHIWLKTRPCMSKIY